MDGEMVAELIVEKEGREKGVYIVEDVGEFDFLMKTLSMAGHGLKMLTYSKRRRTACFHILHSFQSNLEKFSIHSHSFQSI